MNSLFLLPFSGGERVEDATGIPAPGMSSRRVLSFSLLQAALRPSLHCVSLVVHPSSRRDGVTPLQFSERRDGSTVVRSFPVPGAFSSGSVESNPLNGEGPGDYVTPIQWKERESTVVRPSPPVSGGFFPRGKGPGWFE